MLITIILALVRSRVAALFNPTALDGQHLHCDLIGETSFVPWRATLGTLPFSCLLSRCRVLFLKKNPGRLCLPVQSVDPVYCRFKKRCGQQRISRENAKYLDKVTLASKNKALGLPASWGLFCAKLASTGTRCRSLQSKMPEGLKLYHLPYEGEDRRDAAEKTGLCYLCAGSRLSICCCSPPARRSW